MASAGGGARRGRGESLGGAGLGRKRERERCLRGGERCEPPDRFGRGWPRRALLAPVTPARRRGRQRHLLPGQPGVVKPPPPPRTWAKLDGAGRARAKRPPFPCPGPNIAPSGAAEGSAPRCGPEGGRGDETALPRAGGGRRGWWQ